ncbi:MAG TPA: hypothetical protein VF145_02490 [Chitinophagaceae bacterium]
MRYVIACFFATVLFACDNVSAPPEDNPGVFAGEKENNGFSSTKEYRGGGKDVVNEMYEELVSREPALKALEKDISNLPETIDESTAPFRSYARNNDSYYSSAVMHMSGIKDSALKEKIRAMIENSKLAYNKSVLPHERLLNEINARQTTLADLHTSLKIVRTLTAIREYQQKNLPPTAPIEKALSEHERVNQRTKEAAAQ